jgi:hypothetical protein
MTTIIYLNESRVIKSKNFDDSIPDTLIVEISESYLIVGIIKDGIFKNPLTADLVYYKLTDLERFLMCSTNVDFKINPTEFRLANLPFYLLGVEFDVDMNQPYYQDLDIAIIEYTAHGVPYDSDFVMYYKLLGDLDYRSQGVSSNFPEALAGTTFENAGRVPIVSIYFQSNLLNKRTGEKII